LRLNGIDCCTRQGNCRSLRFPDSGFGGKRNATVRRIRRSFSDPRGDGQDQACQGPTAADLPFGDSPIHPIDRQYVYFVHSLQGSGEHVMTPQILSFSGAFGGSAVREARP